MRRYGIAAALSACLLWNWNCGASDPGQPSVRSSIPTVGRAASGVLASRAVIAAARRASDAAPLDPAFSPYQDFAARQELYATSAAIHTFENLSPPENSSASVDMSASAGVGVPIKLGKNWTLRPWMSFGTPVRSENRDTAKPLDHTMVGMSLSCSF